MGIPARKMRVLSDEELFNLYYVEMGPEGSANKIQKMFADKGLINPKTHKPISTSAIWQAINRHLVRNYKDPKIRQIVDRYYIDCNLVPLSDAEWKEMIVRHGKTCFGQMQFVNFLKKHPDLTEK